MKNFVTVASDAICWQVAHQSTLDSAVEKTQKYLKDTFPDLKSLKVELAPMALPALAQANELKLIITGTMDDMESFQQREPDWGTVL